MNWLKTIAAASTVAIIGSVASASTTNLIVNGSFEDIGDATLTGNGGGSWSFFENVTGWTGDPNIEIQSAGTIGAVDAQDGILYAELDTNEDATMTQSIVLNAGKYLLSFFYSPRVNETPTTTNNMRYSVLGDSDGFTETFVNATVENAPNGDFPFKKWTEVTAYFTVEADETEVELAFSAFGGSHASGCGNCGALIDNVSLAAVPLPAGVLLMLSALGAFGFARRRTQA